MSTIALLGAGSWGTALAIHLANCGHKVLLWGHNPKHVENMLGEHCNRRYLPGVSFPKLCLPVANLKYCLSQADEIIIAVPSHAFASLLTRLTKPQHGLTWLTKGIDPHTHALLSELVAQRWGESFPVAIVSGPSFATEVTNLLPTALALASNNLQYQHRMRDILHGNNIRVYLSNDIIGVQLSGAIKNVLAIACGMSDGLGYGANTKAALITRGLVEMKRLGTKMRANPETFMGLAGVGDLVLTCMDDKSRNRRFGLYLGRGESISAAQQQIDQVIEGKYNAKQICALAQQFQVDMPICTQVNNVLTQQITPAMAAEILMMRSPKEED